MAIDIRSWVSPKRMAEPASAGTKTPAAAIPTGTPQVLAPGTQARLAAPGKAAIVAGNLQAPSTDRPIASRHPKLSETAGLVASAGGYTAQAKARSPQALAGQAKKILDWHMGKSKNGMRERSSPGAMLLSVRKMTLLMGGRDMTEEQVAALKEVVEKSVATLDIDMARRCNIAIDSARGIKFAAPQVNDPSQLHPAGFPARANYVAAIVQHTEGQMTIKAIRKMFDELDEIHIAVKASKGEAGKRARSEVESCIRESARSLHDAYKKGRSAEDVSTLWATIRESITDEVLTGECGKYFKSPPSVNAIGQR